MRYRKKECRRGSKMTNDVKKGERDAEELAWRDGRWVLDVGLKRRSS